MEKKPKTSELVNYNRIIFILSIIGVIIAAYVFQSFLRKTSIVCLNSGCEIVRNNPNSYIFGIPVPGFGLVGYSLIVILAFLRTIYKDKRLLYTILGISAGGFLFVGWFTYTELFVIKALCTWCGVSAALMTLIFIISLKSYRLS